MGRRVHIVVPEELTAELDRMVGKRGRSALLAELIDREIRRRRFEEALEAAEGVFTEENSPHWKDPAKWVHDLRRRDSRTEAKKLKRLWNGPSAGHKHPDRRSKKTARTG
jgi:hypothetical protein